MKGKLKNCPYCGKLFTDIGKGACRACEVKLEIDRQMVRDFLEKHPGADIREVASGTGLSVKKLNKMRRDGFLADRHSAVPHPCHSCGKPTYGGMFCNACITSFAKERREIANQNLVENLKGGTGAGQCRTGADFFSKTYQKYSAEAALPLLKSDRAKLKKQRQRHGAFFTNLGRENS